MPNIYVKGSNLDEYLDSDEEALANEALAIELDGYEPSGDLASNFDIDATRPAWLRYWMQVSGDDGPPSWFRDLPKKFRDWAESIDDAQFCSCPGVNWTYATDPTTSRPCRRCGKLRNDGLCAVGADTRKHHRVGCRSVDERHLRYFIEHYEEHVKALEFLRDVSDIASGRLTPRDLGLI